jgi:hypothetical protein
MAVTSIAQKHAFTYIYDSIKITVDMPAEFSKKRSTIIAIYALPNGNTTAQTIGKKLLDGDDWHYDIQHIGAQTDFIRQQLKKKNFVVIYLENKYRSWPAWKQKHPEFKQLIPAIVDSLKESVKGRKKTVYLNGHSGGGSFIFGYLGGVARIPSYIGRISFLDSDYGYDSSYLPVLRDWLSHNKRAALNVFAYNDSVVIYNGKPLVSPTGGTWYRSWLMLRDLKERFVFSKTRDDSLIVFKSTNQRVQFFFKKNPEAKIFHTTQVELNGFIHSVLCGTGHDSKHYTYYGERAYRLFIK